MREDASNPWPNPVDQERESVQRIREGIAESTRFTISYGVESVKTVALINGGAVVAVIGVIAALVREQSGYAPAKMLTGALAYCLYGVISAGLAPALSYISQIFYTMRLSRTGIRRN